MERADPLERLLATSELALFIGDLGGVVVACSEGALRLLNARPEDVIGKGVATFDRGRTAERVEEMHGDLAEEGAVLTNTTYARADGTLVKVMGHVSPCLYRGTLHMLAVVVPIGAAVEIAGAVDAFSTQRGVAVRCAWCGRVRQRPGVWGEGRSAEWATIPVSHGICEDCEAIHHPSEG